MMTSSSGSGNTSGPTSSQDYSSSLIRSMYSHFNHVQSTTNPTKVIKQYDLFQFQ
jgi:hypothetical protein